MPLNLAPSGRDSRSLSLRPPWSSQWVRASQDYIMTRCLKNQNSKWKALKRLRLTSGHQTWKCTFTHMLPHIHEDKQEYISIFISTDLSSDKRYCNKPGRNKGIPKRHCVSQFDYHYWCNGSQRNGNVPKNLKLGERKGASQREILYPTNRFQTLTVRPLCRMRLRPRQRWASGGWDHTWTRTA